MNIEFILVENPQGQNGCWGWKTGENCKKIVAVSADEKTGAPYHFVVENNDGLIVREYRPIHIVLKND